jgi:hypothetical protein
MLRSPLDATLGAKNDPGLYTVAYIAWRATARKAATTARPGADHPFGVGHPARGRLSKPHNRAYGKFGAALADGPGLDQYSLGRRKVVALRPHLEWALGVPFAAMTIGLMFRWTWAGFKG